MVIKRFVRNLLVSCLLIVSFTGVAQAENACDIAFGLCVNKAVGDYQTCQVGCYAINNESARAACLQLCGFDYGSDTSRCATIKRNCERARTVRKLIDEPGDIISDLLPW